MRLTSWNENRRPMSWLWIVVVGVVPSAIWGVLTWYGIRHLDATDHEWLAAFYALVWTAPIGGSFGTFAVVEFNRRLFSMQWLRPYKEDARGPRPAQEGIRLRMSPRIEPIVAGAIERLLFTTLAIVVLGSSDPPNTAIAALGAVSALYIGLKAIKRMSTTQVQIHTSIHSIWGSGSSLAFAVLAGWLYWRALQS